MTLADGRAVEPPAPHRGPRAWHHAALFTIVLIAWFPLGTWWQSDDFIAIHYASDLSAAIADLVGNQYGLEGLVWFYRPLITLSFAAEQAFGAGSFETHLTNSLAHALSACLIAAIAWRFVGAGRAWLAGLVWAMAPTHAASVLWAVGRVDSLTVPWILLAGWLTVRAAARQRSVWLATVPFAAALASKELAMVAPALFALLAVAAAPRGGRLPALTRCWPFAVVLAVYLGWRWLVLGRVLGGYSATTIGIGDSLRGLCWSAARVVDPWLIEPMYGWVGVIAFFGLAGLALAVLSGLRRRPRLVLGCVVWFLVAALPAIHVWVAHDNPQNLRLYYLAFAGPALLIAAAGRWPTLITLLVFIVPFGHVRLVWLRWWSEATMIHTSLDAATTDESDVYIAGLPTLRAHGWVVGFHLGVDRMLRPPFATGSRTVRALRPMAPDSARPWRLACDRPGWPVAAGLPFGWSGYVFDSGVADFAANELPDVELQLVGLQRFATEHLLALDRGELEARVVTRAVRAPHYRVTLFAAEGYVTAILPDTADPAAADGGFTIAEFLHARYTPDPPGDDRHIAFALARSTVLDLTPRFPVMVEPGRLEGTEFTPSHANRQPLWLEFDRSYGEFIGG